MTEPAKIIAEIGCNHKGDFEIAKQMIDVAAKYCKVDYVKFQKRHPKTLLTEEEYNSPHPNPENSYGTTYGMHRELLEFSAEQHAELKQHAESAGIQYACSVWDIPSAKEIIEIEPAYIKIPSACNTDIELLRFISEHWDGGVHISTGMMTNAEIDELYSVFANLFFREKVIYNCVSAYPVPFNQICLANIELIKSECGRWAETGFSGHHLGIAVDIAAVTLGAKWIERHFTLDRTWKGTDHAASLEPDGMRKLVRDIHNVAQALEYKPKEILDCEIEQREKLKRIGDNKTIISDSHQMNKCQIGIIEELKTLKKLIKEK